MGDAPPAPDTGTAVASLLSDAARVYRNDPAAAATVEAYVRRLHEPLRVAIAGMVKAGKSTLLNAIIGEEIAPTDAGECTRIVTWYRYGHTPRVTLHPIAGEPRALPVKRVHGRLVFDLGTTPADQARRLVVDWPSRRLRNLTLIDTPGIASLSKEVSARSTAFLTPEDAPSEADAIVYLLRHMHAEDVRFLESFRDTAAGRSGTVNALAVLSRADEVGAARIDSLLSARTIAARYREDDSLRALALDVVPIAGLLAQSARTLRQSEYAAFEELARIDPRDRERLLVSADRFVRPSAGTTAGISSSAESREKLLDRFGLFGLRLGSALIRGGHSDATRLANELARRSGIDELLQLIARHFEARASYLKARGALVAVETLLRDRPAEGVERLAASVEQIKASAHEFRELRLLAAARTREVSLPAELGREAERLVGGRGTGAAARLGMPRDSSSAQLRAALLATLLRWRRLAENPLTDRATAESCEVVLRSCEALLLELEQRSGAPELTRLLLTAEPRGGPG